MNISSEQRAERKEVPENFRVVLLIGNGSRVPNLLQQLSHNSSIEIANVISHRAPKEGMTDVLGISEAKRRGIQTTYFNLVQMEGVYKRVFGDKTREEFRREYERQLGAFVFQKYYKPHLIVATGWDLILEDFLRVCLAHDVKVLNTHPHPLPDISEDQTFALAPDGTHVEPIRGLNAWEQAVEKGYKWSGVTVHEMIPGVADVGRVHARVWVPVRGENSDQLRQRLNWVEDLILPQVVSKLAAEHKGNSKKTFLSA